MSPASLKNLFFTFTNFNAGYSAATPVYLCTTILFSLLFIFAIFRSKKRNAMALALLCLFIPIGTMYLVSKFRPIYVYRHVLPSSLFYYLIVAYGLSNIKKKNVMLIIIFLISVLLFFALKNYYANLLPYSYTQHIGVEKKKEHRQAAHYIMQNFKEGDIVTHTCYNTIPSVEYYFIIDKNFAEKYKKSPERIILRIPENRNDLVTLRYSYYTGRPTESVDIPLKSYQRIWLIFSTWEFTGKNRPELDIVEWMDEHYTRKDIKEFDGITVYLYTAKAD